MLEAVKSRVVTAASTATAAALSDAGRRQTQIPLPRDCDCSLSRNLMTYLCISGSDSIRIEGVSFENKSSDSIKDSVHQIAKHIVK